MAASVLRKNALLKALPDWPASQIYFGPEQIGKAAMLACILQDGRTQQYSEIPISLN